MREYFYETRIIYLSCLFLAFCFVFISSFASGFSVMASAVAAFSIAICGGYVVISISFKEYDLYNDLSLKTMVFYKSIFLYNDLNIYQKILVYIILMKKEDVDDIRYEVKNVENAQMESLTIRVNGFKMIIDFYNGVINLFLDNRLIYKCERMEDYSVKEKILSQFGVENKEKEKIIFDKKTLKQKYKELKTKK